ncbi:MAG: hypothetical protein LQ352_005250 [Teloschistes flavicans]|nr:MAG: hypothetical protein LQ352_005250 [Teloschistes flavicans]
MWLLETKKITLHEFNGDSIPPYAILSHTWDKEEVSHEMISKPEAKDLAGYSKIKACCDLAASQDLKYAWIDTCCIDKKSSAELSEAINSMWRWYEKSAVCYAYLQDCEIELDEDNKEYFINFQGSRWFTRGWTLQELLAPAKLVFYDAVWKTIGNRQTLSGHIHAATGINSYDLHRPRDASCAAKMSWMSKRQTTRSEDLSYSLLGLFDVYMPLIYGEGENAFLRLQHEIVKTSNDESIFAWTDDTLSESGMFALSPKAFAGSGDIVVCQHPDIRRRPYSNTNFGLAIEVSQNVPRIGNRLQVPIACSRKFARSPLSIWLSLDEGNSEAFRFNLLRLDPLSMERIRSFDKALMIYVKPSYRYYAPGRQLPSLELRWDEAFKEHMTYLGHIYFPTLLRQEVPGCFEKKQQNGVTFFMSSAATIDCKFQESSLHARGSGNEGQLRGYSLRFIIGPSGRIQVWKWRVFRGREAHYEVRGLKAPLEDIYGPWHNVSLQDLGSISLWDNYWLASQVGRDDPKLQVWFTNLRLICLPANKQTEVKPEQIQVE